MKEENMEEKKPIKISLKQVIISVLILTILMCVVINRIKMIPSMIRRHNDERNLLQQLERPARNGFVTVEWGGTEIK